MTDAQLDNIAEAIASGVSMSQAARANGVNKSNLRLYARNHPRLAAVLPPIRPQNNRSYKKKTPERLERLRELWSDENLPVAQIATELDVSKATVQIWAAEMELRRRGKRQRRIGAAPARGRAL
ncbi:MerR family transcriptional regulator [Streptomyces halobius]|uniref:Helix-turn-helix domain-containing protein n=1 Tax=Streptomyces halobius TaxID=2879846 RepID=A0ABY4M4T3_9ACTN|nr:MerR family transcriptional regulator [Streptomyces halobius]UQA91375.1 helix-turn-helix domain-containing protein [Streptomyces halobius]